MLTRLKFGLFRPSQVSSLKDDKKIYTVLFFILMVLLSLIPFVILVSKADTLSYETKREIRSLFRDYEIPYEIRDYKLTKTSDNGEDKLNIPVNQAFYIVFDDKLESEPQITPNRITVVFAREKVYLIHFFYRKELFSYSEYRDLENLDLSLANADDHQFWDKVFPIVRDQLDKTRHYSLLMQIGVYGFLFYAIELLIFSLIVTLFLRTLIQVKANVKFSQLWRLIIYLLAPYVIFRLFADLYGLSILSYVGIITTIIYAIKMNNSLTIGKGVIK